MKKYFIVSILAVILLTTGCEKKNTVLDSSDQKKIEQTINEYYKQNTIHKEDTPSFTNKSVYEEQYYSKYAYLDTDNIDSLWNQEAKKYYETFDLKNKYKISFINFVSTSTHVRVLLKVDEATCTDPSLSEPLLEKYPDLSTEENITNFFSEVTELTKQCFTQNKTSERIVSMVLKKRDNAWLIDTFDSVLNSEVTKKNTILKQGIIDHQIEYADVKTPTDFRFIDASVTSKKKKSTINKKTNLVEFPFSKNQEVELKLEVMGTKGKSMMVQVLDENQKVLSEKEVKMTKSKQIVKIPVTSKKRLKMIQVYLLDTKDVSKNTKPLDEIAFGRLFIYPTK